MKTLTVTYEEIEAHLNKKEKRELTPSEILQKLNGAGYLQLSDEVRIARLVPKLKKKK